MKLVFSPVQLYIEQLVNHVTDNFAIACLQVLRLAILGCLAPVLFQFTEHIGERLTHVAFEVFEVYKHAEFLGLSAARYTVNKQFTQSN